MMLCKEEETHQSQQGKCEDGLVAVDEKKKPPCFYKSTNFLLFFLSGIHSFYVACTYVCMYSVSGCGLLQQTYTWENSCIITHKFCRESVKNNMQNNVSPRFIRIHIPSHPIPSHSRLLSACYEKKKNRN